MNLILLAGESLSNRDWIEQVEAKLRPYFEATNIQYYKHWKQKDAHINIDRELGVLAKSIERFDNYIVFAKSAGTVVTLKGVYEGLITPKKSVFLGMPLKWMRSNSFPLGSWIFRYRIPTMFIQKERDPQASYQELSELIKGCALSDYQAFKLPGEDHNYEDLEQIETLVREFIK